MKNPLPTLRTFARAVQRIENWPTAVALRLGRRRRGLRAFTFRDGLNVLCRPGTEDWDVINEIFLSNGYAQALKYLRTVGDAPHVLDLGANIGMFSLRVAAEIPTATVAAYEPAPPTAVLFRMNQLANPAMGHRIVLHEFGVGGTTRQAKFFYDAASPQSASICYERGDSLDVQIKSFSEIVGKINGPIALAKIDVEGAEFEIVRQTPAAVWARIAAVSIELHDSQDATFQSEDLLNVFRNLGYSVVQEDYGPSSYFLRRV